MRVIKTKEKEMKSMKKRNLKFMALLLSITMVFTTNAAAFAANPSVNVEAAESEAPEVLGLIDSSEYTDYDDGYTDGTTDSGDPSLYISKQDLYDDGMISDAYWEGYNNGFNGDPYDNQYVAPDGAYGLGFTAGLGDHGTDVTAGNTAAYDAQIKDFSDNPDKYTVEWKAGYYDGYAGEGHDEYFTAYRVGFEAGINAATDYANKDAVKNAKDGAVYKEYSKTATIASLYRDAFDAAVATVTEEKIKADAYDDGYGAIGVDDVKDYATLDKYLASAAYTAIKTAYANYVDGYFASYENGVKAAFENLAKTEGYKAGRGVFQGANSLGKYTKVSEFETEAAAQDYADKKIAAAAARAAYMACWKTYNNGWEKDADGNAKNPGTDIVGATYIENYQEGYNAGYTTAQKKAERNTNKQAYCDGFSRGYEVGTVDGQNNNDKADKEDKEKDINSKVAGTTYFKYTETDKQSDTKPEGNTPDQIAQFIAGYNLGYEAATTTKAYDDGYNTGYDSGFNDATNDQYVDDFGYYGYWEHDYPNSPYNILKDSDAQWAKGYVAGYDEGYNAVISGEKTTDELAKDFDYSSSDMDPWRASTDPLKWETSQLLVNENNPGKTGNYYNNLFFDTREFDWNEGIQFKNKDGGGAVAGRIVATSPFQYYFDLNSTDHLVDKKTVNSGLALNDYNVYEGETGINNGSIGQYVYAAFSASSNKPKKAKKGETEITGTPYVIVRYRLAGSETDENYKVRRYAFDSNGKQSVVVDHINNYYQGTDKAGNVVNEPVVPYDSRKIAGVKENKDGSKANNDKANRYIIDAEALLISWTEGQPATLIGEVPLKITAKDNVNATVPHDYINFLGDTAVLQEDMTNPHEYSDDAPVILKQTDKPVPGVGNVAANVYYRAFSKYYAAETANKTGDNEMKGESGVITFKGAESAPKLTAPAKDTTEFTNSNVYVNKKGTPPTVTLKAGKLDPKVKAYSKDIKLALKNASFTFEISRMKISSDYVSNIDTMLRHPNGAAPINAKPGLHDYNFGYEDTVLSAKLAPLYPVAPKRSECSSLEDYQKKVQDYKVNLEKWNDYVGSEEFQALGRAEFEKAVKAYRDEYNAVVTKYGSKLDYMQQWIEKTWIATAGTPVVEFSAARPITAPPVAAASLPYTVTKQDRTDRNTDSIVPLGKNEKYRKLVPEDADCDGIITAVEHYEYTVQLPNWPDGVDDARFNGKLEAGDNIRNYNSQLIEGDIVFDEVAVGAPALVSPAGDMYDDFESAVAAEGIAFTYSFYPANGGARDDGNAEISIKTDNNGKYIYHDGSAGAPAGPAFWFKLVLNFFDDQETDIGIVEGHDPCILWPGAEEVDNINEATDIIDIDFVDPVIKPGKKSKTASGNSATMAVKAVLHTDIFDSWAVEPQQIVTPAGPIDIDGTANVTKIEKKLKVFAPKPDKTGAIVIKKLPKADIQMESKMAESEPFVLVTGINNYEGQIAIRQRKNGELGYGYFKNDDFYYLFNDEE